MLVINEQIRNHSREVGTIKKSHMEILELKNLFSEIIFYVVLMGDLEMTRKFT